MYQVLYRKWRPQTFSDVVGQPQVTITLANEIISGSISHAYLFTGTRGTGKTTCARILAKALCCEQPKNGNPCNECSICKTFDEGGLIDVVEIDAASNRSIDDIKLLKEKSAFLPTKAKYRIYIIDEVHMLSVDAFNALLKLIEEPPEHLIFIFATTEVHKVLPTIQSRCQKFNFRRIDSSDIADRLNYVCKQESREITETAALMIARISDGAMRDSLSLLDRCFVYDGIIDETVVSKAAGVMSRNSLFDLSDGIADNDSIKILQVLDNLHKDSCDSERVCTELIEHYRNFMLVLSLNNPEDAIVCTTDDMKRYKTAAKSMTVESTLRIIDSLCRTFEKLKYSKTGRVELETALLRLGIPEINSDNSALAERISKLELELKNCRSENKVSNADNYADETKISQASAPHSTTATPKTKQEEIITQSTEFVSDLSFIENDETDKLMPFDNVPVPDDEPIGFEAPFEEAELDDEPMISGPFDEDDDEPIASSEINLKPTSSNEYNLTNWERIVERAKQISPPLNGLLNGTIASIEGNLLIIKFPMQIMIDMLNGNDNFKRVIKEVAEEILGEQYEIRYVRR
ncbi:MAG TPA: DNA polymerase III subunit gamma/tau [Clostridiales bacterium]|nr:DNA polymerase III subunit gamma/tau [Clostridiales bacterium]